MLGRSRLLAPLGDWWSRDVDAGDFDTIHSISLPSNSNAGRGRRAIRRRLVDHDQVGGEGVESPPTVGFAHDDVFDPHPDHV